eukprot:gene7584-8876_t
MAGGVYNAEDGNSNLNVLFLNVTIGRSPYTQGDVIIDFITQGYPITFLELDDIGCGSGVTNITFNSLTLANGTQGAHPLISTLVNYLNIIFNNVTVTDFTFNQDLISVHDDIFCEFHPYEPPTLTINGGGGFTNCFGGPDSTMIDTSFNYNISVVESSFSGNNNFEYILSTSGSNLKRPITITKCSFTDNIGCGVFAYPMLYLGNGQVNITDTLFNGNTNVNELVYLSVVNSTITGTTFTNNNITKYGDIMSGLNNIVMDNCTFSDNIAPALIATDSCSVTLNNITTLQFSQRVFIRFIPISPESSSPSTTTAND